MNRKYCERWLKSCLKKKVSITATTIIMFLMTGLVVNTPIFASVLIGNTDGAPITPNGSVVSSWGITIGGGITNAGSHSVHVGDASLEEGERNVIIGTHATAGVDNGVRKFVRQSVAIGGGSSANQGARAFGDQSIAIGANTIAEGNSSVAIGNDDVDAAVNKSVNYTGNDGKSATGTIGDVYTALTGKNLLYDGGQYRDTRSKEAAVAIGVKALAGDISLALGTASSADVVNGVAIGTGATVTRDNAIAIGGGATTEKEGTKETDVTVNGIHYTWKGGENTIAGDVVSFGKEGYERQLKHVAAGKVSEGSTDAINGSQLHGVLEHITSEPVYFYAADNSSTEKITGTTAKDKNADALAKNIVARSMSNHRLNILGGATGNLSDNNIGVNYENDSTLRVKLAKELKDLKSTEFKNDTGDVATITGNGLTITPNGNAVSNKNVSVTKDGLNNGGNVIANVGGNLDGAKTGTTVPTTNATVPNNVDGIKNNAATVGDVLQAGWNLQEKGVAKDFVKPYDTVNFVDGKGTTVVVNTEADRSTSTIKYDVNLGKGLQKDDTTNEITVKADEKSLTVGTDGVKAKTDNKTITTGDNGLKVVTGDIESVTTGTVKVTDGDTGKIATVDSVVNAVNNAAFTLKASAGDGTRNGNSTVNANGEAIKAGNTIEMIAGKNLEVTHNKNGKITFATVENPSFETVQVGNSEGPKFSATTEGNISVSDKEGTNPVKITNVKDGKISANSKDAINGSQFHKVANNTIKLAGQNGDDTATATETNAQNLNKQGGIKFTVKSSNGDLLEVTAAEDTVTLTPKTAKITTGTDGVPTANTTDGKLVTADNLVTALTKMGWKATAGNDGTGTVEGNAEELIKAGNTVTFKAGDNLKIKQDGKNFIYSLNPALTGLTSAEFKDGDNKVKITPTGITITKPAGTTENTVTLNQDGLNNGGNLITNVASNLEGAKAGTTAPTTKAAAPNDVVGIKNNAATVGDVLQSGWNLQGNGEEKDFVKPYDTVNFANGDGTTATVETTNNKVSTVKYSVNLGDGLKKDDTGNNTISIKPADKSLEVNKDGVKVKTDGTTITTDDNKGLKVVTGAIESVTTGNDSGTVKVKEGDTGKIATVDSVVNAVNSAAFTLKASATTGGTRNGSSSVGENGEDIKAGKTIEMIAGKNLNVTHNENGKIIFATVDNPSFSTVQVGGAEGPKLSKTTDGDIKVSDKDGVNPVKITNVKDGAVTDTSTDAINGSQFHKVANNTIKLAGQNGDDVTTATQTKEQNLNKQGGIKFTVKSSDGKLLEVKAADDTITLTPKTATITTGTDGVPTANTNDGKLVTADDLVTALKNMGWKAIAGQEGSGTVAGNAEQLIKAGETVTFKAGNNLAVKQAGKEFIYSLKQELTDLTKVEVKDKAGNAVVTTPTGTTVTDKDGNVSKLDGTGLTITPNGNTNVSVTKDGIKAGDKAITNVASSLTNYNSGNKDGLVDLSKIDTTPNSNVATVGDLRNMGWVVSSDKRTGDLNKAFSAQVKNANEVEFIGKNNAVVSATTDGNGKHTVTVDVTVPAVEKGTIETATGNDKGKVKSKAGDENKFTTVDTVVNAINSAAWKATSGTEGSGAAAVGHAKSDAEIKAGDTVTFKAGDNLKIKQAEKEFTYSLNPKLTNLSKVEVKDDKGNSVVTTPTGTTITGKDATDPTKDITTVINAGGTTVTDKDGNTTKVDGNGITITSKNDPANPVKLTKDGFNNGGNKITNVTSGLEKITTGSAKDLVDLSKPTTGEPTVKDNTVATVGDLRNMGWVVSSDKTTGDLTKAFSAQVKNANEVKFVGTGMATVSGKTETNGVRTITVNVDPGKAAENSPFEYGIKDPTTGNVTPVVKGIDGKYYNKNDLNSDGTPKTDVTPKLDPDNTSDPNKDNLVVNAKGDKPQEVKNVKSNLPATYNKNDNKLDADGKPVKDPTGNIMKAGTSDITKSVTAPTPADLAKVVNNAATVGDVLNAGWNLKNNGEAKDFVKPYDTVNFVNGGNTTAVVTTDKDGTTSNVTYNVTGLPVTYTNEAGKPVSKVGDNYYVVNEKGEPVSEQGLPAVGKNAAGKLVDKDGNVIEPIDTTTKPLSTNLVNPNVATDKQTTTPTQLGNVANGAKTYDAPEVNGKKVVQAKDGKWYNATDVVNGKPNKDATPVTSPINPGKAGLVDFSKSNPTNVATVGDLQNMGWIVSSDKTTENLGTAYNDQVRNANEVKFVGKGTAIVSGKTDDKGVRTITVEVNDQVSTNNSVTPVVYTKADGTKVYPIKQSDGTTKFNTKPDGTGEEVDKGAVITSVNGPEGTTTPTTLKNIAGNLPKTHSDTKDLDGTTVVTPTTSQAKPDNIKNIVNNAATVGDVLNAGWNLKNNGEAKDFVKPYDTVNFVNGGNTTAVVTTDKDGTTSNVTYNVTGLPVTYTNEAGKPVSKVGDNYYVVNEKGEPVSEQGLPAVGKNAAGKLVDKDGNVIEPIDTTTKPLSTNLVNPNVATDKQTTTPTQLGNVANGAKTFEAKADANGNPLIKVGTDYYTADQLDKNGQPKAGETPKTATQDIKMGKDGKWYPADKIEADGTLKANAVPVATPVNPGKAGLVDFNNSNPTNVATVGDLQNMGWVVGTPDNNYNDQVRNANKVDFKGGNGIEVTGKTTADGTREITVAIKEGEVTNEVTVVRKDENGNVLKNPDGTDMKPIEAIRDKDGKLYAKDENGKADKNKEITLGEHDTVTNNGSGFVTGNTVATAIQESGWNVGKANAKDVTKAFETEAKVHDKVNPNDNVKFVDGDNTTVSMVTIDSKDENGTKVATTYIKTDINRDIHIDSVTTGGKITNNAGDPMMLGNDGNYYPAGSVENNGKYYPAGSIVNNGNVYPAGSIVSKNGKVYPAGTTLDKDGNPTVPGTNLATPITTALTPTEGKDVKIAPKTELTDNGVRVTPAKPLGKDKVDPNKVVNLTNGGLNNGGNNITNVKGNLPQVNDVAKTVFDPKTGVTTPVTVDNITKAPITASQAADIMKPTTVDGKGDTVANPNYAGNNAATVGDVLNAGWNLQNNDKAKDFVKPYDTVNFVDGINTKVTVETSKDGTKSDVRVDVVGLPIAFADKDGNRLVQVKDKTTGNFVYYKMKDDGTASNEIVPNSEVTVTNVNPVDSKINTVGTRGGAVISGIANGAKTYDAPKDKDGNPLTKANDGKWYLSKEVNPNGTVIKGSTPKNPVKGNTVGDNDPRKAGLINFSNSNSNPTNAATVADLQNMGWVVSTSDTGYNDQVRNANVVDFKEGEGIKISGETLENGVRQIKVGIDKNVVATKQELAQVARLSSAGIAGVAAMANIPQINEAASNRYNIAVGVGYHKGEKALAVGISGVSDGGRVVYKASAALDSQKQTTVGLGIGYQFGKRDIEPNELDRFRAQLDLVNTQKSSLAQKLKEETHKVVELNNKVEELEKQNKMLNEKMDLILKKLGGK